MQPTVDAFAIKKLAQLINQALIKHYVLVNAL